MRSRAAIAVVRGLRELRSSGRSQTQRVRAGSVFIRPGGGVRSATSGRRAQRQLARAVWARSVRGESIERKDCDNDGTNAAISQESRGNPRFAHLAPRGRCYRKPDFHTGYNRAIDAIPHSLGVVFILGRRATAGLTVNRSNGNFAEAQQSADLSIFGQLAKTRYSEVADTRSKRESGDTSVAGLRFCSIRKMQYPAAAAARCLRVCPLTRWSVAKTGLSKVSKAFARA